MLNCKKLSAMLVMMSLISVNTSFAATNFSFEQPKSEPIINTNNYSQPVNYNFDTPLRGSVVQVPAGSSMHASLSSEISSESAAVGDAVNMYLSNDFYYNNSLIAPAGSVISGTVIEASSAKHGTINGRLCVRFTQITTPVGNHIPISAIIKTDDNTGILVGGTKMDSAKEYTKDLAVGSAAGALSGLVFGALAGGSIGRGVALGTAVGAGGGLVKSVVDKGVDVIIPSGSNLELVLTQPITTSVSAN